MFSNLVDQSLLRINKLIDKMTVIEQEIAGEAEVLKKHYASASSLMTESQNYFLGGVEAGPSQKSYLLTSRGIEVLGEEVVQISTFIDNVIRFANSPKKKLEVLNQLVIHLKKIDEMISQQP